MLKRLIVASIIGLSFVNVGFAAEKKPTKEQLAFFESKIRPVLIQKCYRCHSAEALKKGRLKGGLLLDTKAGIRKGGETGPAITPGNLEKSLLIAALRHEKKLEMPPSGKLSADIIADFVKWVEMGAPDPREGAGSIAKKKIDIEAGKKHWAFQPLKKVKAPAIQSDWIRNPIDRFILARLSEKGISPNQIADRRTLIRRVYFDLLGLPPTPEQVNAFANDASPDAYAKLIDELLKSPHYGERWARHWLDLARFAESNGYAFDKDRPNAYHYRDFVIKALNDDMAYDQFVRWQLAGDLLTSNNALAQSATGFLVAGPFTTQQTQKERERSRYEQLDDMIATVGTSMLGLTLGCARCHDHKYDPLPTKDYYRLIASLREVGRADVGIPTNPEIYAKAKATHDREVARLTALLTDYEKTVLPKNFEAWVKTRPAIPPPPSLSDWHSIGPFSAANMNQAFRKKFAPEKSVDLKKKIANLKWTPRPTWKDGVVHNTLTGDNSANYLHRVIESQEATQLRLSLGSDDSIKVWVNGQNVLAKNVGRGAAADQEKITINLKKGRNDLLMKIVNGGGPSGFYFKALSSGPPLNVASILKKPAKMWKPAERNAVLTWYRQQDDGWKKRSLDLANLKKKAPKPQEIKIFSAKKRGQTYNFGRDTYKVYFLNRGNPAQKQGEANPGYLQVLTSTEEKHWDAKESRVALANWMTDVDKGAGHLLARVIVNRLWHHHFGRGIVSTPSDFGVRGERPTHPGLLDWLAQRLIEGGWKLKPIHRLIMTSAVYMQQGKLVEAGKKHDPDNLLLWRRSPKRLEAEIIRDSLLAISGTLDEKMYGKGSLDQRMKRRSIYLTVKRSRLIPILQLFDAPDTMQGVGKRQTTTVAPQALAMMNSPFVRQLASGLAKRARADAKTTFATGIENAYEIALARKPSSTEKATMLAFLDRQAKERGGNAKAQEQAWLDFCHLLLCLNEVMYVD